MVLEASLKWGHILTLMFHFSIFFTPVMHPFLGGVIGFDFLQEDDTSLTHPLLKTLGTIFPKKRP
jgi:hypothetical protein